MKPQYGLPKNLQGWIEENRASLAPPVCNAAVFEDGNYIINVVGGGNQRTDFHDNPTEEIFYQLRGEASLIVWDRGKFERVHLKEGDIFLQPAHFIHSPQRPDPDGLCLLVELQRPKGALDALQWYCANCATQIWRAEKQLESLIDDLPATYNKFYALSDEERVCPNCGTQHPGKDYVVWHKQLAQSSLAV